MTIGLEYGEIAKAIMANGTEIRKALQNGVPDWDGVSTRELSVVLYKLLSDNIINAIQANNRRIAEQLSCCGS